VLYGWTMMSGRYVGVTAGDRIVRGDGCYNGATESPIRSSCYTISKCQVTYIL
jgi:hypothetical protein